LNRTKALKQEATKQGKPSNFLIFNPTNMLYFANFSGANALLIPEDDENILYVSGVNYEQAKEETEGLTVELLNRGENLFEKIARQLPSEKFSVDTLQIESWRALAKAVSGEEKIELANNLIRDLRKIKDEKEIDLIRKACKLADIGIKAAAETIRPGVKEKEVAAEIEHAMRMAGSDGVAFETIVASGYCCAYPHGTFLEKIIQEGDFVVVDLGAIYKNYRSDITRTFTAGKASDKQTRIYRTVKSAQQKAYESIKPGISASEVDLAARRVIDEAGFAEFFVHNLGHGVGLDIHEAPILSPDSKDILEMGNVVTIEPGIYLPGFGGVRIEDTVVVTQSGAEKLTTAPILP
jgi:Xaa-Pro dipeptidase